MKYVIVLTREQWAQLVAVVDDSMTFPKPVCIALADAIDDPVILLDTPSPFRPHLRAKLGEWIAK